MKKLVIVLVCIFFIMSEHCFALSLLNNGRDWNKANNNDKVVLAEAIAIKKGYTTSFWFAALNEYYDATKGSETLNDSIEIAIYFIKIGSDMVIDN